jgi:hypothetical protein
MYGTDLIKRQFAGHHNSGKAASGQETYLIHAAHITLGACMQGYGWKFHAQDSHILNEQSIGASLIKLPYQFLCIGQFRIFQYGIYGNIYLGTVKMGKPRKLSDIIHAVTGSLTCTEPAGTYIHGIGSMLYGLNSAFQVPGG